MTKDDVSPSTAIGPDKPLASGVTRLGPTIVLNGEIEAHEDILVEGRVQGKITLPSGTLTVAKGGRVEAEVRVRVLVLHGELNGTVRAGEKALISETADDERRYHHPEDHHRQRRPLHRRHPHEGIGQGQIYFFRKKVGLTPS